MQKYNFPVEGMTCASCVARVEKVIGKMDGVSNVNVNFATEHVTFETDRPDVNLNAIAEAVKEYGYNMRIENRNKPAGQLEIPREEDEDKDEHYAALKKDLQIAVVFSLPVFAISMLMGFDFFQSIWTLSGDYTNKILLILSTPVIFISGKRFYKIFWNNLKHFTAEMNSLVAISTGAAYIYSMTAALFPALISSGSVLPHVYFDTAVTIITLILLGRLLEHNAKRKTTGAIKKLIELQPKTANIISDGKEISVKISELRNGQTVVIRPGDKLPADGIIISGSSSLDESMITGEAIPVEKVKGAKVIGGTINKNGTFNYEITATGDNSVLGQIIRLVEEAQASKPPIQKLVDKVAAVFVPAVILVGVLTFVFWFAFGSHFNINVALINFVAVLIIACPCALGLATPTAIIVGSGVGASNGILIKNGESIELAHKISTVIFDKTGTITEGKPSVTEIIPISIDENKLLGFAASIESKSAHPIAKAITDYANRHSAAVSEPEYFVNMSGFGLTGIIDGSAVAIGNLSLMEEYAVDVEKFRERFDSLSSAGKTAVFVAIDGMLKGIIAVEDTIKTDSAEAIRRLESMGIKTVMITGDNVQTAKSIADKLGIKEFMAEVKPDGKAEAVKKFQGKGEVVAMVGDGINDAPALAQADVSIAIGTGTDVAIETAQITLVNGNLTQVAKAINISHNTIRTIKQNLFWAFIYNTIGIPLAAFGMLNPMLGALAMSFSSVSVVTNSLRLKKAKI